MKSMIFLLFFMVAVRVSEQLDCTQIAANDQVSGKTLNIPDNAQSPVDIPANFSCIYTITPPKMVYAVITVTSQLVGSDDVITVIDGQSKTTVINSLSTNTNVFYVFPQTSTTVNISNKDDLSKFQMKIVYSTLPAATQSQLQKNQNLNYFKLSSLQLQPVTVSSDAPIALTLGRSGHVVDDFSNYFAIDGSLDAPKTIRRLEDFQSGNFNSTGNQLTVVGLDNKTSFSTVMFNSLADLQGCRVAGITVADRTGVINVKGTSASKTAVMIVAPDSQQLVLTNMNLTTTSSACTAQAITGPPNYSQSSVLIDFAADTYSLPQLFPYPFLTIIVQNCNISFTFVTSTPTSYYKIGTEKSGFIFSPSYFDLATKSDFNVTFEYTGSDQKQFVVEVVDVTANSNTELDIDIYDSNLKKTLSSVITGNQVGTKSRAFGKYLNVHMSGNGTAKLQWQLTSSGLNVFGFPMIILAAILVISI